MTGTVAFVGGSPFSDGCDFDRSLLERAKAAEVLILPTAAAYESPQRLIASAESWFEILGAKVRTLEVFTRQQALDPGHIDAVRAAPFIYLAGGSAMHLRSVLMHSPMWEALVAAFEDGAVVAGASAGAQVLGDPMVDSRGGAFTIGLGLLPGVAAITEHEGWRPDTLHRTRQLAPPTTVLLGIDSRTAVLRGDGRWWVEGAGSATAFQGGHDVAVDSLTL